LLGHFKAVASLVWESETSHRAANLAGALYRTNPQKFPKFQEHAKNLLEDYRRGEIQYACSLAPSRENERNTEYRYSIVSRDGSKDWIYPGGDAKFQEDARRIEKVAEHIAVEANRLVSTIMRAP